MEIYNWLQYSVNVTETDVEQEGLQKHELANTHTQYSAHAWECFIRAALVLNNQLQAAVTLSRHRLNRLQANPKCPIIAPNEE